MALALALLHAPSVTIAEGGGTVTGTVRDAESGAPLGNTNVYLASTTIGTNTDARGTFRLSNVPPGVFQLVASRVGYKVGARPVEIRADGALREDFSLTPVVLKGEEVQVIAHVDREWRRDLEMFTRAFIGEGPNARACRLLNPEVLDFRKDKAPDVILATTDSVLQIENRSLGYTLYARLALFRWDIADDRGRFLVYLRFDPMRAGDSAGAETWTARRAKSYNGSLRHFLSSLVAGKLEREHFSVSTGSVTDLRQGAAHPLTPENSELVRVPGENFWRFAFDKWLRVDYRTDEVRLRSYVGLTCGAALVDSAGNLMDPLCLEVMGDWARSRVADMLPIH